LEKLGKMCFVPWEKNSALFQNQFKKKQHWVEAPNDKKLKKKVILALTFFYHSLG
jgi:hypothetical protein